MKQYTATINATFTNIETRKNAVQSVSIEDNDRDTAVAVAMLQLANMRQNIFEGFDISCFDVDVQVNA